MHTCTYVYFGPYQVAYWLKQIPSLSRLPKHAPLGYPLSVFNKNSTLKCICVVTLKCICVVVNVCVYLKKYMYSCKCIPVNTCIQDPTG